MQNTRIETDSMGPVEVPAEAYWGAQTQRSLHHFSIGTDRMPQDVIRALAIIKKAAAQTNNSLGKLPDALTELICSVADEIVNGSLDAHFPLHVWMTGSGTQSNMNVNEVIANRASELSGKDRGSKTPVHPNDHVNMSQSSNDVFPAAMSIAAAISLERTLLPELTLLRDSLAVKAREWAGIVKIGRTHMQDAVPLTLGQEFSGYVGMLDDNHERITTVLPGLHKLALGGTAVGTGLNTPKDFAEKAAERIADLTGLPFRPAPNFFTAMGAHDDIVQASATLKTLAVSLNKIANDIRLLSCGPRAGLGELILPANEPGSSIMPGKINPTQCEALSMVALQVMAYDTAVSMAGASGILEINLYKPMMIFNLLQSAGLLADACSSFRKYLVEGMVPNKARIDGYLQDSLMLVTALNPVIGYDKAARVAHQAYEKNISLKQAALELQVISEEEFDRIVNPYSMAHPHEGKKK